MYHRYSPFQNPALLLCWALPLPSWVSVADAKKPKRHAPHTTPSVRADTIKRLSPRQRKLAKLLVRGGTLAETARDLSRVSGEPVSWERVHNWIKRGSVPKGMLLHVQKITRAPLKDLVG